MALSFRQASESEDAHVQVSDDPRVGTELAGYRLERLLGRGGMSVVYLAEDGRLSQGGAEAAGPGAGRGPGLPRPLPARVGAGRVDRPSERRPDLRGWGARGVLFIAMRYVEGRDLRQPPHPRPSRPGHALILLSQVASALDVAHAHGLVHRDVKPGNVLARHGRRPDGSDHVYLSDFGLARRVSEEAGLPRRGHVLGTIDYVSPEQVAGEPVDGRADVYSLGCVLVECLFGQPPFRRDSDIMVAVRPPRGRPPAPSTERPELPGGARRGARRALAKDPAPSATPPAASSRGRRSRSRSTRRAAARRRRLPRGRRQERPERGRGRADRQGDRPPAGARAGACTRGSGDPGPRGCRGDLSVQGPGELRRADAEYFFGRERLIAEMVARLVGARFLGVVGPSGSGKSSRRTRGSAAGPRRRGPARQRGLAAALLRPGEHPVDELRRVPGTARRTSRRALDALPAARSAPRGRPVRGGCSPPAATRPSGAPSSTRFSRAARRRCGSSWCAAGRSLRPLRGVPRARRAPRLRTRCWSVRCKRRECGGDRAARRPGRAAGEPALADALVADVEDEPGVLPLLSTALVELWQQREGVASRLAAYLRAGGVQGAVARLAERTYAPHPDERRRSSGRCCCAWRAGEGAPLVRRRVSLKEFDPQRSGRRPGARDADGRPGS